MENKMETRFSLVTEEGYLIPEWLPVPGESSERPFWVFPLPTLVSP